MKKQIRLLKMAGFVSLLMGLLMVGVALATTITVDGNPADWPGHPSCTAGDPGCSFLTSDPDEATVPDANDIVEVWVTNSPSDVYFRLDTVTSTSFASGQFVRICMDMPSQGPGVAVNGCPGLSTDRMILLLSAGARVADCNALNCNDNFTIFFSGAVASVSTLTTVTEVGATITSLGLTSLDDGDTITTMIYFDNNNSPPDDNIPDSGTLTWTVGTGSPTAITLTDLTATPGANAALVGAAGLVLLGTAFLLFRRSRKHATVTAQED